MCALSMVVAAAREPKLISAHTARHVLTPFHLNEFGFADSTQNNWVSSNWCYESAVTCSRAMPYFMTQEAKIDIALRTGQFSRLDIFSYHFPIAVSTRAVSCKKAFILLSELFELFQKRGVVLESLFYFAYGKLFIAAILRTTNIVKSVWYDVRLKVLNDAFFAEPVTAFSEHNRGYWAVTSVCEYLVWEADLACRLFIVLLNNKLILLNRRLMGAFVYIRNPLFKIFLFLS